MKNFSSSNFSTEHTAALELALSAVAKDPQALFSDFQWFLFEAKDAVYFTAFSKLSLDHTELSRIVGEMVALAPQLSHGFVGALPGRPFPQHMIDAIIDVKEVESFEGYPDHWLSKSEDIFARGDLPLFRVQSIVLKGGPDAEGRASMVLVRASHALLEGADSALLTNSRSAARGALSEGAAKASFGDRVKSFLQGQSMTWTFVLMGNLFAPKERPWGFKTLAIKRHRLRTLANRLGVRQRSLYFALVMQGLNGEARHLAKKSFGAAYTLLGDPNERTDIEDDFLRVRAIQAKFPVRDDFVQFVREIDDQVEVLEKKDISKFMKLGATMMKTLRGLHKIWKGFPGKRFWRFNLGIDIALTLVPPHRAFGPLTKGIMEPIYCGAWHPAQNICTYCPGRTYLTMNFSMDERHIANVDNIMRLLERVEAMDIAPSGRKVTDTSDE